MPSMKSNHTNHAEIPVIDISKPDEQVSDDLIAAVVQWGFVYVHGEIGFTSEIIDEMFEIVSCMHYSTA